MYWILMIMGFIAALVIAVVVGGMATPRDHVASRSALVAAPVESVYEAVRNVSAYPEWRGDLIEVEIVDPEKPGLRWREISSGGSVTFGVVEEITNRKLTAKMLDEDQPWGGTWTWEFAAENGGTRVTITERGYVNNVIFRFIATHFMGFTKTMTAYLNDLRLRVESRANA